jgi:hypothetical protein
MIEQVFIWIVSGLIFVCLLFCMTLVIIVLMKLAAILLDWLNI